MKDEELEITVVSPVESPMGVEYTRERKGFLTARLVPVTPENIDSYFPDYRKSERYDEDIQRLSEGKSYWCVAVDPETENRVGGVFVNCEERNLFGLQVEEEYQRRGVAKQLIKHLQGRFDVLTLDNTAGRVGEEFYSKMGFTPIEGRPGRMLWEKSSYRG